MTADDALPPLLMRPTYVEERNAVHSAVKAALEEDARGSVSGATAKRVAEAVSKFRGKFSTTTGDFELGYNDALDYFTVMAGLSRLLNDPSMQAFFKQLDNGPSICNVVPGNLGKYPSDDGRETRRIGGWRMFFFYFNKLGWPASIFLSLVATLLLILALGLVRG